MGCLERQPKTFATNFLLVRERRHQIHHISNDACGRVIGNHVAVIVAILIACGRWRHPAPVRRRHRANRVIARNRISRCERRTLAIPVTHRIRAIVLRNLIAIVLVELEIRPSRIALRWTLIVLRRPLIVLRRPLIVLRRTLIPLLGRTLAVLRRALISLLRRTLAVLWRTLVSLLRWTLLVPRSLLPWRRTTLSRLRAHIPRSHHCGCKRNGRQKTLSIKLHDLPLMRSWMPWKRQRVPDRIPIDPSRGFTL